MNQAITLLAEEQMLSQLMQEQEVLDRRQISLIGLKTNQQMVGKNQYAMDNNVSGSPKVVSSGKWNLKNVNLSQADVSFQPVGRQVFTPQVLSRNTGIGEDSQLPVASLEKEIREQFPNCKPYLERFNKQAPYNTLFMDKNCSSCMSDFTPHLLSHIKMACLNYVNQPITYQSYQLTFEEVLQIKEYLLIKLQNTLQ